MLTLAAATLILPVALLFTEEAEPEWRGFDAHGFAELDRAGTGRITLNEYLEAWAWSDPDRVASHTRRQARQQGWNLGAIIGVAIRSPAIRDAVSDILALPSGDPCRAEISLVIRQRLAADFREMDTDGDGHVSAEEYSRHHHAGYRTLFDRFDRTGDGIVTRAEYVAAMREGPARTETIAANSFVETSPPLEACAQFAAASGPARAEPEAPSESGWGELFDHMDTDGDGVLSFREYAADLYAPAGE